MHVAQNSRPSHSTPAPAHSASRSAAVTALISNAGGSTWTGSIGSTTSRNWSGILGDFHMAACYLPIDQIGRVPDLFDDRLSQAPSDLPVTQAYISSRSTFLHPYRRSCGFFVQILRRWNWPSFMITAMPSSGRASREISSRGFPFTTSRSATAPG